MTKLEEWVDKIGFCSMVILGAYAIVVFIVLSIGFAAEFLRHYRWL